MATIQWRPEVNALTTPQSYWIRFVPRSVVDSEELAKRMAKAQPNYSEEEFRAFLTLRNEIIQDALANGEQVTEENNFTYTLSFTGRLDEPDDPLPDIGDCLQVRIYGSPPFIDAIRQGARTERLPMNKKLPVITSAEDTLLKLNNVLNPQGTLQLTGTNLQFDQEEGTGECVLTGTRSGKAVQTRVASMSNTSVMILPDIPAQSNPWNNEYTVSISTHYSSRGTARTGTYDRMLRAPLLVNGFGEETGILTGKANSPNVSITGGVSSGSSNLRIEVVLDLQEDILLFSLKDMKKEGEKGPSVTVSGNGAYTLEAPARSLVTSLDIRVNSYAALKEMVWNDYSGRLVDILDIQIEPA